MILIRLMNEMPLWLTAIMVVAVAELYSVGLMLLCRLTWGSDRLSLNNEVAGFKFSVIGVLYAVLLGFVVIAVWEDYRNTETAVRNEAKAIADLTQISYALPESGGSGIRDFATMPLNTMRPNPVQRARITYMAANNGAITTRSMIWASWCLAA